MIDDEIFKASDKEIASISANEIIEEMAKRGLILPRPPTLSERIMAQIKRPFLYVAGVFKVITWTLFGRRLHEKKLERETRRMKQLAGLAPVPGVNYKQHNEYHQKMLEKNSRVQEYISQSHDPRMKAEHDRIIKTKIVREQLPKPDVDDSGLN